MQSGLRFLKSLAVYLAVVVGGLTLFLVFAPLFGYMPYSDRPGPGWFGSFPAVGWREFWENARAMLEFGLFFVISFLFWGPLCVLSVRLFERTLRRPAAVRAAGGLASALLTGIGMLGAGWYISAGVPLLALAVMLGAVAGALCLPARMAAPQVSKPDER